MTIGPVSKKRAAAKAGKELQAALGFAYENLGNYLINDDSDDVPQSSVHSQEAHHVPKVSHLRPVDGRRAQRPSNDLALGARKTSSELLAHGSEELGQSSSANAGLPPTRARETGKLDVLLVGYKVDQGSPTRQRSVARLPGRLTRRNTEIDKKTDAIEDPTESALLEGPSKIVASGASELVALGEEDDIVPLTSIEEVEGVIAKYAEIVEKKSRELMSRGLSAQSRAEQDQSNDVWPSREDRNSDRVLVEQEPLRMDDAMDVDRDEEPVLSTASPIGIGREHRLDETTVRESNLEDEAIHHEIDIPQEQLTTTEHLNVDSQVASDDAHAEKSAQINVQSFMPEPFGENTFISSPRLWAQTEEVSPIPSTDDFQSFNLMAHPTADQSSPDQTKHEVPRDYLHADSAPEEDAASQHFFTRPSLVVASLKGIIESRKRRRLEERESAKLRKLETNPLVFAAYADPEYSPVVTEEVIRRSAKKRQVSISDLSRAWPTEVLEAEKQVLVAIATNINEEADNVDQKLPGDHIPSESTVIPGLDLLKLEGHVVPSMKIGKKEKFAPAPWNVSRPFSIAGRIDAIATDFSAPKVIIPAPLIHHGSVHQPLPPRPLSWISQVSPAVRKVSNSEQITMAGDKGRNKHVKKISVDMTDRPRQQEASHVPLNLVVEPSSSSKMRPETNPLRDARPSRPAMGVRALPGQRKPIGNAKGIHSAERRPQEWEQQAEEWRDVLQIQAMMPPTETKHEFLSVEDTWRPQTNEEVIKAADMHGEDTHALARADESGTLPAASVDLGPGRASSPPVETHPPVLTSGSHLSPDIPIAVDEPAEDGNGSSDEDFAESGDVPPIEMANESPLSYYTRKRRMSMGLPPAPNLEIDTSTSSTISGSDSSVKDADALEAIPASPTLSSSSSLFSLPNAVDLKQRATSAARTVAEALQKKGVSAGRYPDFYEVAHGAEARKRLTDEERLKYPVLKGETFHGLDSEEKLKVEIKRLDVLIREGSDSLGDRSRRGMVWAILGEMKKATMDFDAALKSGRKLYYWFSSLDSLKLSQFRSIQC
ncbi:hypothetical protein BC832DRAFT_341045 [Gaertneriomyces semiglobifer]|nr:hypothetical protein BC832DRAFT_341045 [Gaertneriomyces semiglobifer]